jgi:hypothetical protein
VVKVAAVDPTPLPGACVWLDPVAGYVVSGQDKKVVYNVEVDECKTACEAETTFSCYSFDYRSDKTCFLQSKDRYSTKLVANAGFVGYYERNCRCKSELIIEQNIPPMLSFFS